MTTDDARRRRVCAFHPNRLVYTFGSGLCRPCYDRERRLARKECAK